MGRNASKYGKSAPGGSTKAPGGISSHGLLVLASAMFTGIFAVIMLMVTSVHEGVVFGPDEATRLLAIEMVAVTLLLAITSASLRMRLGLQMVLIYMTIYLILPGYHHSSGNIYPFFKIRYDHDIRLRAAVIISVFIIALYAGYILSDRTQRIWFKTKTISTDIFYPNPVLFNVFTVLAIIAATVYVSSVGIESALGTRAGFKGGQGDKVLAGLIVTLPRMTTFLAFAYCYVAFLSSRKMGMSLYYLIATSIPFFLTNFPLVLPRYVLFGILLFFLVQTVDFRSPKARSLLSVTFLIGALFAMPYADSVSRHTNSTAHFSPAEAYDSYLSSGDFDGLQSIQNAVIYNDLEGNRNGIQLLSAAFFFVPRAFWSGKGEPTGELTSKAAGYSFFNVSQPLPSEFYVDFGLVGMAALTFVLGLVLARLDGWIDRNWDAGPRARLVAGIVVAFAIIFMRGSLLGIIPSIVTFAFGIAVIIWIGLVKPEQIRIRRRRRPISEADPSPRVARHMQTLARRR